LSGSGVDVTVKVAVFVTVFVLDGTEVEDGAEVEVAVEVDVEVEIGFVGTGVGVFNRTGIVDGEIVSVGVENEEFEQAVTKNIIIKTIILIIMSRCF